MFRSCCMFLICCYPSLIFPSLNVIRGMVLCTERKIFQEMVLASGAVSDSMLPDQLDASNLGKHMGWPFLARLALAGPGRAPYSGSLVLRSILKPMRVDRSRGTASVRPGLLQCPAPGQLKARETQAKEDNFLSFTKTFVYFVHPFSVLKPSSRAQPFFSLPAAIALRSVTPGFHWPWRCYVRRCNCATSSL